MAKVATIAAGNVFYKRRIEASTCDSRLRSREGAAEVTGLDRTRLANIELDNIIPHPEEVLLLSDTYNAPELCNHYCSKMCPLGKKTIAEVEATDLERTVLQLLSAFQSLPAIKEALINIAANGEIDTEECAQMESIIAKLDEAANRIQALKLYFQKHYGNRTTPPKNRN